MSVSRNTRPLVSDAAPVAAARSLLGLATSTVALAKSTAALATSTAALATSTAALATSTAALARRSYTAAANTTSAIAQQTYQSVRATLQKPDRELDDDSWHVVTASDYRSPPRPSVSPPDTAKVLTQKWFELERQMKAAIRAGDVEAESAARAAMSGVRSRIDRLDAERVRREALVEAEGAVVKRTPEERRKFKDTLRAFGKTVFKETEEERLQRERDRVMAASHNSFYEEDDSPTETSSPKFEEEEQGDDEPREEERGDDEPEEVWEDARES
ncbi:hypothetical protein QBC39DRAFT_332206 [Podospora conica]|nr:hypothetical protein QBC39DRAFT_332206 [Schizothecium conicum]